MVFPELVSSLHVGSTWNQDHDTKEWSIKSFKISNTKLSRPAYLPHVE